MLFEKRSKDVYLSGLFNVPYVNALNNFQVNFNQMQHAQETLSYHSIKLDRESFKLATILRVGQMESITSEQLTKW